MSKKKKDLKLGATGKFPMGKLNEDDEGELRLALGLSNGKIIFNFGKPVAWLGLDYETATSLNDSLSKLIESLKRTIEKREKK